MLYRVLVDGEDILDYNDPEMVLLSPQAVIELDVSGSFEFTVPPNHKLYNNFTAESIMPMTVEIYEDDILHWFGRPIEIHLDFYKNKKLYCEGALGFFNDSVIRAEEYEDTALSVIFAAVIDEHNSMVPANRQFTVGNFTVTDHIVYRKFNYEQTSDVLKSKFLDAEDGHFFLRRVNGVNYIDFLKDMPYSCNQDVQFAENLLNFTYSFDGKDFATCVIPLGGNNTETGEPINIKSVNSDSDILIGNAASNYGKIVKVQQYSDITDPAELLEEGRKYLTNLQYNAFLIECSAVDLHSKDSAAQLFRVGQKVNCISSPHGISLELPISKITLYLDSAAKQITLGRIPKKTLSRFYKEKENAYGGGTSGEEDDILPAGYGIIDDPYTGEPTLIKVPVMMQIMTLPYRDGSQANSSYEYGDTLQFDGLTAKLVAKGQTQHGDEEIVYFVDSHYDCVTGVIPFGELSFDPVIYNKHAGKIMVWCTWTNPYNYYNGVKFKKAFYMHSLTEQAAEDAKKPHHITIEKMPAQLEYFTGGYIHMSGAKVVAYMEDNSPYQGSGYSNGVIPNSELVLDPGRADIEQATKMVGKMGSISANFASGSTVYTKGSSVYGEKYTVVNGQDVYIIGFANFNTAYNTTYYGGWLFSKNPFTYTLQSQPSGPGSPSNAATGSYNGQPYYYAGRFALQAYFNPTVDAPMNSFTNGNFHDYIIAALFGDVSERQQTIEVQWTPPSEEDALTTTFDITVKESEHGR